MKSPDIALLKAEKQSKKAIQLITNKVKTDFSMRKIKTVQDYLRCIGHDEKEIREALHYRPDELSATVDRKWIVDRLDDLRIANDTYWWLQYNPPDTTYDTLQPASADLSINMGESQGIQTNDNQHTARTDTKHVEKEDHKNYDLPKSDKEKATLFWFQKKYAKELLEGIVTHNKHAQLLVAAAGHGKTFIIGAVLRRLFDMNFCDGKTMSPWPMFYVTKASVVEQTKRVLETSFNIDTELECKVTNYDQLRATLGEIFVKERTQVDGGIEYTDWTWSELLAPCVFVFDECQAAKNESSTQAKIVMAVSRIKRPVYCIFSSATPFTRVSEAKYFVVNAKLNLNIIGT